MTKTKILSGASSLPLLLYISCIEVGIVVLCSFWGDITYILLVVWSVFCIATHIVFNRIVTIVAYDPENAVVTRRGLWGGYRRELQVADIIRTEIRTIPYEGEYILLIDKEAPPYVRSLSRDMPICIPNTAKGRAFVASFMTSGSNNFDKTN